MIKTIILTALLTGCQTMMVENDNECTTDGGIMQDEKIGPAPNVWKIWDHDNDEWWAYFQMSEKGLYGTYQWDSYGDASFAIETAYEEDPTSIPQLMNYVEFKLVRVKK